MAPKAASSAPATGKQYDEVVVVALLMAIKSGEKSVMTVAKDMAQLDGKRTTSGFEHSLRAANKLANELVIKKTNGGTLVPADMGRDGAAASASSSSSPSAGGTASAPATPRKRVAKGVGKETACAKKAKPAPSDYHATCVSDIDTYGAGSDPEAGDA